MLKFKKMKMNAITLLLYYIRFNLLILAFEFINSGA
jgi:hypothetical protein